MSLIARFFEDRGISTVSLFLQEEMAKQIPAPRMVHVRWPLGNPYGEPNSPRLQAMMLRRLLEVAGDANRFGYLDRPDWPWKRTEVELPEVWSEKLF